STYPVSFRPRRKARTRSTARSADSVPRNPITGFAGCCARTTIGKTAAPIQIINSRRLIVGPEVSTAHGTNGHDRSGRAEMSALGQKRTSHQIRVMSALPPKADIRTQSRNVCFVPEAEKVHRNKIILLDNLVSGDAQRLRYRDAERLGRFEVDNQQIFH